MKPSPATVQRRKDEIEAVLQRFVTVNAVMAKTTDVGYGYSTGYLQTVLARVLSSQVSEKAYKEILDQLRDSTNNTFAKGL
jgi:hypothetical protein